MPFSIVTIGGQTVGVFSTKPAAVKAAQERLKTVPFNILSPEGDVVHSTIPSKRTLKRAANRKKEHTMTDATTDKAATKTAEPKPTPAPPKPLSATAVKDVLKFNPAWNDADKKIVTDLITKHVVSDTKTSPKGDTVRLISGTKTVAWVNSNRIDFPDGSKVKFSTARAPKPAAPAADKAK